MRLVAIVVRYKGPCMRGCFQREIHRPQAQRRVLFGGVGDLRDRKQRSLAEFIATSLLATLACSVGTFAK